MHGVCSNAVSSHQLEDALELDSRSPILHYNMGQAREVIGEMEGAIAEYKLSLDNDIRYMDGAQQSRRVDCSSMDRVSGYERMLLCPLLLAHA